MLLSVVLSFRNEAPVIPELIKRLQNSIRPLNIDYELIFVNDASADNSLEVLKEQSNADKNIKILNMSRNFGNGPCVLAGIQHAKGDAVVYMDADLQDPPELIPKMFEEFQKGTDVVYTTRLSRRGESAFKIWLTKKAYRFLRRVGNINLPLDSGDFKLLSRNVVDELSKLREKDPFVRGLVTWVGFKQVPVFYNREERFAGKTHYPLIGTGPLKMFLAGLTSFSSFPLKMALVIGFVISILSFLYLIANLVMFFLGMNIPGWTAIMATLLILGGTQLITVGFVGLYLGRVYDEVKNRPNYIVESKIGFE
ncbi:MAG: glycosyltransferase family 2 protein [Deltaproteobacteria bacterium]|nr:glycosyltransferase family 2 protein [Deltaproteobacteria bacterium]